jgi:hypothetical protein
MRQIDNGAKILCGDRDGVQMIAGNFSISAA